MALGDTVRAGVGNTDGSFFVDIQMSQRLSGGADLQHPAGVRHDPPRVTVEVGDPYVDVKQADEGELEEGEGGTFSTFQASGIIGNLMVAIASASFCGMAFQASP